MRRIPISLPPVEGESLDSWLIAYASRLDITVLGLANALGLDPGTNGYEAVSVAVGKPSLKVDRMVAATGLSAGSLGVLWRPLARYRSLVENRFANGLLKRVAVPLTWSRFCPACLEESGGRWQMAWRIPWFVACPTHERLLSSVCPNCSELQRKGRLSRPFTLDPSECSAGSRPHYCRAALAGASDETRADPTLLSAQERLAVLVQPNASDAALAAAVEELANHLTLAKIDGTRLANCSVERRQSGVVTLAATFKMASDVLADRTDAALTPLVMSDVGTRHVSTLPSRWRTASQDLVARVLKVRDPHLPAPERLRWQTTVFGTVPTYTDGAQTDHAVPSALWPDWAIRLTPTAAVEPLSFRVVAAAAIALPGRSGPWHEVIAARLDANASVGKVARVLSLVAAGDNGTSVLRALTQLSIGLRNSGCPIDYVRRRSIGAREPTLSMATWDQICEDAAIQTGRTRKLQLARLWLWELITGGPPQHAPVASRPKEVSWLAAYHGFCLRLPEVAARRLELHARETLDSCGCGHEPTAWSPPTEWVDDDEDLALDLEAVDLDRVGDLLRSGCPPSMIARDLSISLDHVRYLIRRSSSLAQPHPTRPGQPERKRPERFVAHPDLRGERLRRLVIKDRRTMRSVAKQYGVSTKWLRVQMQREGIPSPREHLHVDADWLRTQYVEQKRTMVDIASELGTSQNVIARRARQYDIPLRPPGGASHAASVGVRQGLPEPLATALRGKDAALRVLRFQTFARFRSLTQAGNALGVRQRTLSSQLAQLEARCGGRLLVRATRRQEPQRVTELGSELLQQADEHLGRVEGAPARAPEFLETVLKLYWGVWRLNAFIEIAANETIAKAAVSLRCNPYQLHRSLRKLEAALGEQLLIRTGPSKPHRLTDRGNQLLREAEWWLSRPPGSTQECTNGC